MGNNWNSLNRVIWFKEIWHCLNKHDNNLGLQINSKKTENENITNQEISIFFIILSQNGSRFPLVDSLSYGAVTNLSVTELYRCLPLTQALFHCILSFSFYVVSSIHHHVIMASSAVLRFRSFLYPIRWNINPKTSHICPSHSPAQSLAYMTYKNYPLILFTRPQTGFHSNRSELRN